MPTTFHACLPNHRCNPRTLDGPEEEVLELSNSVGQGGANRAADVRQVQTRLNRVATSDGGPSPRLVVDGLCGPLTKGAIKRFQQHFFRELVGDGRIDPGKNTWKKLLSLSGAGEPVASPVGAPAPKAPKKPTPTPPTVDPTLPLLALGMSQFRIFEAIKSLDVAAQELQACQTKSFLDVNPTPASFFNAYTALKPGLKELPTVDRCFKVVGTNKATFAKASDSVQRLRKLYVAMVDVIVTTMITTPKAEATGSRRFVRTVPQAVMNAAHPGGAMADGTEGGWWLKNANFAHIRIGSAHVDAADLVTTLIHEMSHFVSHPSTYMVGNHVSGIYKKAFNDTHQQAVRNAFCYEWFAFLASFKTRRSTPDNALELS